MYARGMTTREIQGHLQEMYGVEVSPTLISEVIDGVIEEVKAWQNRLLEPVYGVVYLDALYVKMRHEGAGRHPSRVCGRRHRLGWTEGRAGVVDEQQRGRQVLVGSVDGVEEPRGQGDPDRVRGRRLKGFPQAI